MSVKSSQLFSSDRAPNFGRVIKGASAYFISKRHVKGHAINGVFVTFQRVNEVSTCGVPDFTSTIIAASEKLIAIFVEAAVGEGEYVAFGLFDEGELLYLFVFYFFYQF